MHTPPPPCTGVQDAWELRLEQLARRFRQLRRPGASPRAGAAAGALPGAPSGKYAAPGPSAIFQLSKSGRRPSAVPLKSDVSEVGGGQGRGLPAQKLPQLPPSALSAAAWQPAAWHGGFMSRAEGVDEGCFLFCRCQVVSCSNYLAPLPWPPSPPPTSQRSASPDIQASTVTLPPPGPSATASPRRRSGAAPLAP